MFSRKLIRYWYRHIRNTRPPSAHRPSLWSLSGVDNGSPNNDIAYHKSKESRFIFSASRIRLQMYICRLMYQRTYTTNWFSGWLTFLFVLRFSLSLTQIWCILPVFASLFFLYVQRKHIRVILESYFISYMSLQCKNKAVFIVRFGIKTLKESNIYK